MSKKKLRKLNSTLKLRDSLTHYQSLLLSNKNLLRADDERGKTFGSVTTTTTTSSSTPLYVEIDYEDTPYFYEAVFLGLFAHFEGFTEELFIELTISEIDKKFHSVVRSLSRNITKGERMKTDWYRLCRSILDSDFFDSLEMEEIKMLTDVRNTLAHQTEKKSYNKINNHFNIKVSSIDGLRDKSKVFTVRLIIVLEKIVGKTDYSKQIGDILSS